jgi:hypothetical protein
VVEVQHLLHHVREGAVPGVVQERGGAGGGARVLGNLVALGEEVEHARHQVERAQAVREARVLGALVGEEREAELLDAPQPLELERVDEAHHQPPLFRVGAEADDVVHGVAVDALAHVSKSSRRSRQQSVDSSQ